MGRMVVLAYKPHQGKERELRQLMRDHRDALLAKGLVTDMTVGGKEEAAAGGLAGPGRERADSNHGRAT